MARVTLLVNAAMASIATAGFFAGFIPYASEHPILARRAAAGELAGVLTFLIVASRIRRDPSLIVLPIAFVACQIGVSLYELLLRRTPDDLPPMVFEGVFLSVYLWVYAAERRARASG